MCLPSGEEIGEQIRASTAPNMVSGIRYRTMAKTLSCDYTLDLPNFQHISPNGKDFISKLLVLEPEVSRSPDETGNYSGVQDRLTAGDCLSHPWMTDNRVSVGWAPDTRHLCSLIKFVVEGLCGSSALSTNFLDARYLVSTDP